MKRQVWKNGWMMMAMLLSVGSNAHGVERKGMTWGLSVYDSAQDVSRLHCCGEPKLEGNACGDAYQGDTLCSEARPVVCLKVDGASRPPYEVLSNCPSCAMNKEYYQGWAEGTAKLTEPIQGNTFATLSDVNAYCEAQFGPGYRVAEHHDGRWVSGMSQSSFYGSTWPLTTSPGGWGVYVPGKIPSSSRFWAHINGQNANCWDGFTVQRGSIGDQVWADPDKDGNSTLDGDDYPLSGIKVMLRDAAGDVVRETTTYANGKYLFSHLEYGTYSVEVDQNSLPSNMRGNVAHDPDGGDDGRSAVSISGSSGPNSTAQDFAFYLTTTISFTVTPSAGTGGSISPDSPQTVSEGTTTSFTVLADSGYKIENVEGCGGTLSGSTYTTAPVTEDCAVTASFTPHPSRNGMTWGINKYIAELDITRVHCYGQAGPNYGPCNPYQGDTSCSVALPVLCVKVDGTPRPAYALATCSSCAMPDEYYNGWAEGSIGLTAPAQGNAFATLADADAYCAAQLGEGYKVAEHHTGRYVMGMDENNFYGSTWPANTSAGGWGLYGPGQLVDKSRFWVDINDQDANCWGRSATTATSLSVNSSGASGVAITGSPSAYSGATNYSKTGIPSGTVITLTAPAASGSKSFIQWGGCDSTDTAARTCTVTMYKDKAT